MPNNASKALNHETTRIWGDAPIKLNDKMKTQFPKFDPTDYLTDEKTIAAYLKAATESSCPELLELAIKNIERARAAVTYKTIDWIDKSIIQKQ